MSVLLILVASLIIWLKCWQVLEQPLRNQLNNVLLDVFYWLQIIFDLAKPRDILLNKYT